MENFVIFLLQDEEISNAHRALLQKQIATLEDELSEAKLESSKLKTEIVSEKSAWEIKLSELQSRINEVKKKLIHIFFFSLFCQIL